MSDPPTTIELLKNTVTVINKTANGPAPADALKRPQWEMSGAHALIITGFLSIYEQAPSVLPVHHRDFVQYALIWLACLQDHHWFEEELYFPMFPSKFESETILREHEAFHQGILTTEEYLVSCLPIGEKWGLGKTVALSETRKNKDVVSFDGEYLRKILEGYVVSLLDHLQAEIQYLEPANLTASGMTEADVIHTEEVSKAHHMKLPMTTMLTWAVQVSPNKDFPPAPNFIKHYLVPWVFYWYHSSWWQFVPKK